MRYRLAIIVGSIALVSSLAWAQHAQRSAKTGAVKANKVQEDFAAIDRKWLDAERRLDIEYCEKFFADSYVLVTAGGQMFTKREWLDILKSPQHPIMEVVSPEDVHAHVFGNVAILTDRTTLKGHMSDGQSLDGQYEVFRVLLKQNGEWKAAGVSMNKLKQ